MKICIAPDSFKNSMSAVDAATCIAQGLSDSLPHAKITKLPMADGGEGITEVMLSVLGGTKCEQQVSDPLGKTITAYYGVLGDGKTAVVEMAAASGLALLPIDARNPMLTTTYGTGQLIASAIDNGLRHIILGVGGSATVDGGIGMAQALGIQFLDEQQQALPRGALGLNSLHSIDTSKCHPQLHQVTFEIACDVNNPLLGDNGAARVYAPQKGASPEMVLTLEQGLQNFASIIEDATGKKLQQLKGAGAAGGIALPLLAFANAHLRSGIDIVLEAYNFQRQISNCDLVITGEGRLDGQSSYGKVPVGVAREAKKRGIPVVALCGSIGHRAQLVHEFGIDAYFSALQYPLSQHELPTQGPPMLTTCAQQLGKLLAIGFSNAPTSRKLL